MPVNASQPYTPYTQLPPTRPQSGGEDVLSAVSRDWDLLHCDPRRDRYVVQLVALSNMEIFRRLHPQDPRCPMTLSNAPSCVHGLDSSSWLSGHAPH